MVSWETLPDAERARITRAVNDALAARLTALADDDGESPGPPEIEFVAATGDDAELTVHFVAHKMIYAASLDSDDAEHAIYVGRAVSGPNQPVTITEMKEHREFLRGLESSVYDARPVVQRIREQILARLQGLPVPPASDEKARATKVADEKQRASEAEIEAARPPEPTRVYRCPRCGSTSVRPDGGVEEFTVMKCSACGLRAFIEQHEIDTDWTVDLFPAPGEAIPAFLPPLPPPVEEPEPEHAPIPPLRVEPPPKVARVVDPRPTPMWPDETPENLAGDSWTKDVTDLRCPRCDSTQVYNDTGRAERHFTFFSCRSCDHGEEMCSLAAIGRWRRA